MEEPRETVFTIPWKESILDEIRERPAMYLGLKSLTALWFFLHGYELGKFRSEHRWPSEVQKGFSDWVAYRLHLQSNCKGFWHGAILSRVRDESLALDRFFELRDEFAQRESKVVATIREDRREYRIGRIDAAGTVVGCTELLPASLKIIVYTDDPGFFLSCEADESFSENGCFFPALSAWDRFSSDRFQVHDELTWHRLTAETVRYRRNLAKRRTRNQKKIAPPV